MAWRSSGATNAALVENMARNGLITSSRVKQAMLRVDRAHYTEQAPYQDSPQYIGHLATISAPHMHASACESLLPHLQPGSKVLDVGCGSGYLTHVLAELVKPDGKVVGIDHIQPLVDLSRGNTRKSTAGLDLLRSGAIRYITADGRLGWKEEAPYDAIHVGAAAADFHQELIDQLKAPGRLFIPVEEDQLQHIWVIDKDERGVITRSKEYGVRYVPLTDTPKPEH
ncbi:protein-L-isoaspartate O-methyltransferas-like protein [Dissoconium aciculare CBS 342.82]|uniref:Protein-L-isoaspartate O-methyltransferase n=1 Tax=Dissoconium aciculare CBS 342.82 TaxID=1314786 RepID=A0A6J3ME23_9PEZI|nr:protein-L-isoaspartate O-methyltransferas-like protein [Dissoconium aciculare CBS 342.82]KAF1825102.1 protein-L-isoaspartate O-methyltransferas-like protein [Dissoconium aciculare CBS 342.82]